MERLPRGVYSREFRHQVVRLREGRADGAGGGQALILAAGDAEKLGLCGLPRLTGCGGQESNATG